LYWIIPALILAGLIAWFFASNRPEQVGQPPVKTTMQSLMVGGVDVGKEITGGLENLRTALQGVTDADSTKAALPNCRMPRANRQGQRSDWPAVAENSCGTGQTVCADCQPAV
jgi:hypothetical protein